ncbi:cell division protein FtsQ/DivIB [Aliamphritea hakodatensis]|uniref:cell division protein FtsQ/DivIB n=1 Tax=Aliamphritea hakodatensis TaxID=2895352 RepID=UPI0022FD88A7|nr:cell division protein FtsQ/DivIB [Aliamphritea hakodatensis]
MTAAEHQDIASPAPRGASRTRAKAEPESVVAEKHTWRLSVSWQTDWWLKPVILLTAVLVFAALAGSVTEKLYIWLDQPVTHLTVKGQTRFLDKTDLANKSLAAVNGGLMSADINRVKAEAQAHPWVYQVNVERQWPASLVLEVKEEVPVARWGGNGLLNHEGDIFWPEGSATYQQLPLLEGPSSNTGQMMAQYYELSQRLRHLSLQVDSLQMEARGAWSLKLKNGVTLVLGREDLVGRLERFVSLYQLRLKDDVEAGRIDRIDVRYENGVAVKWRPQPENAADLG